MVSRGIVVTGALGGIGAAVARRFARQGASLCLIDAVADDDGNVSASLRAAGAAVVSLACADITDDGAIAAIVDEWCASQTFDVLVNVAGAMIYAPLDRLDAAQWRRLLDVNLVGAGLLTGHALRRMPRGGTVINVGSVHARRTSPDVAPYAAAKAGLLSLTRSTAIEGKPRGVTANAILPGAIDTAMLRDSPNIRSGAEVIADEDVGSPDDVAAIAEFLASDDARFINGAAIVADGGRMGRL